MTKKNTSQLTKVISLTEPLERIQAFKEKISRGWEDEYNEYRKLWTELPKKELLENILTCRFRDCF